MTIVDILQIFILAAVIFIPCGYFAHQHFPLWRQRYSAWFLSPRYLRPIRVSSIKSHLAMAKNLRAAADKQSHHD